MTGVMLQCSNDCGRSQSLKHCSRCKLANYCSRECQAQHWKVGGHRHECFQQADNNDTITFVSFVPIPPSLDVVKVVRGEIPQAGSVLYLGTTNSKASNSTANRRMILSDSWNTNPTENNDGSPVFPDLAVDHVPPMIIDTVQKTQTTNAVFPWDHRAVIDTFDTYERVHEEAAKRAMLVVATDSGGPLVNAIQALHTEQAAGLEDLLISPVIQALRLTVWSFTLNPPGNTTTTSSTLVGKSIQLGGGIEMIYMTSPGVCFAQVSPAELGVFASRASPLPILRVPMISYRNPKEGWRYMVVNAGLQTIVVADKNKDTPQENDTIALKIVIAAAEINELGSFCSMFPTAFQSAIVESEELALIYATKKIIPIIKRVHPHGRYEASLYWYKIGLLHESRAARFEKECQNEILKRVLPQGKEATGFDESRFATFETKCQDELHSAAVAYKTSAELTKVFYPHYNARFQRYNALGATLVKLKDYEMAKRAFMWCLTDPSTLPAATNSNTIHENLIGVWEWLNNPQKSLGSMRYELNSFDDSYYYVRCTKCERSHKNNNGCSRCQVPYCSKECQEADWPRHQKVCSVTAKERMERKKTDPDTYSKYADCPDSTREMMEQLYHDSIHSSMKTKDVFAHVEHFDSNRSDRIDVQFSPRIQELVGI